MHVRVTKPDGTVIDVEGTPQECAALLDNLTKTVYPVVVPVPYVYPQYPQYPLNPTYPYYYSPTVTDVIITSNTGSTQH